MRSLLCPVLAGECRLDAGTLKSKPSPLVPLFLFEIVLHRRQRIRRNRLKILFSNASLKDILPVDLCERQG